MTITVVHAGALGDTLLLVPLLRSLRQRFPQATLQVVCRRDVGPLLMAWKFADSWHAHDDPAHTLWFADGTDAQPLPWTSCDLLISFVSDGRDPWARWARRWCGEAAIYYAEPRPPADADIHVTAFHLQQLSALDLPTAPLPTALAQPAGPVVLHPGSGGIAKCWPLQSYVSLARECRRLGLSPLFLLGDAEHERWGPQTIAHLQAEFAVRSRLPLPPLAEALRRAQIYVGNDSGVSHLAACLGVPTLALFGPTSPVQWKPVGPRVTVIRSGTGIMADIPVAEVLAAVQAMADLPA